MTNVRYGATAPEWEQIGRYACLWPWVLPTVCDPRIPFSDRSSIPESNRGKVPCTIRSDDGKLVAVGVSGWPTRPANERDRFDGYAGVWAYGAFMRTGHNGLIAADCDVEDANTSSAILDIFARVLGCDAPAVRRRGGKTQEVRNRWAILLQLTDSPAPVQKVVDVCTADGGKLEWLTAKQGLAIAGTHPSGARYEWDGGITVYDITREQLQTIRDAVRAITQPEREKCRGVVRDDSWSWVADERALWSLDAPARATGCGNLEDSPVGRWLRDHKMIIGEGRGGYMIRCPWEAEHTTATADDAAMFFPGDGAENCDGFKCLHAHCEHRTAADLRAWIRKVDPDAPILDDFQFPDESAEAQAAYIRKVNADNIATATAYESATGKPAPESRAPDDQLAGLDDAAEYEALKKALITVNEGMRGDGFIIPGKDKDDPNRLRFKATAAALATAVRYPIATGRSFRFDTFTQSLQVKERGRSDWRTFKEDTDWLDSRVMLELVGFRTPKKEDVKDAINAVATSTEYDSMIEMLSDRTIVPEWDGVPRVVQALNYYLGVPDNEYTRKVSTYLFTALYARASRLHGIKADICVVFHGRQGVGKSTAVRYLALQDRLYTSINFSKTNDDIARSLVGHVVAELPEMVGLNRRAVQEVKDFLSTQEDHWVKKYKEHESRVPRRCIVVMTTNEDKFLTDTTGNRRFAPVDVATAGDVKLNEWRDDMPQLWAEAGHIFAGFNYSLEQIHRDVERLSAEVNKTYQVENVTAERVLDYLDELEQLPVEERGDITISRIQRSIGNYSDTSTCTRNAIIMALTSAGYVQGGKRGRRDADGKRPRIWIKM